MQWIWCFSSSLAGAPEQYAALLERARFRLVNDIDGVRCHYSGSCACPRAQPEPWCQLRVICVVLAMCGLRPVFPDNGKKSGHSGSAAVPHQLRNRQNDSTLVLVQGCSVPKTIEFVLNSQADVPPAGSKLVETLEVGGAFGGR
jgi:hypothetical protein